MFTACQYVLYYNLGTINDSSDPREALTLFHEDFGTGTFTGQ